MGKWVDLIPMDVRDDRPRKKMAGPTLDGGGHPLPLLSGERGHDGLGTNAAAEDWGG